MNSKKVSFVMAAAYIYLALPVLIFLFGWCRLLIAVPMALVVLISLWKAIRSTPQEWSPLWDWDTLVRLLLALFTIVVWVVVSGIGRGLYQNPDHSARNTIYEILVTYDWPVINTIQAGEITDIRMLVYYIGFWLPSALVGKLAGMEAGYRFQVIWAVIGIFCVYYMICVWRKKIIIWPLMILIFFSGLDVVGSFFFQEEPQLISGLEHIEWWAKYFQYSSMTTQLFWVYNQAIPAWVATMLLWMQDNRKNTVFIISMVMLSASLPFIGLLPIAVYVTVTAHNKFREGENVVLWEKGKCKAWMQEFIKEIITIQNVIGGSCIGILSFLYLKLNSAGQAVNIGTLKTAAKTVTIAAETATTVVLPEWGIRLAAFAAFAFLEFGVYLICMYVKEKYNPLYYLELVLLLIIPFLRIGVGSDFSMRASIPALFVLMLLIIKQIDNRNQRKDNYTVYLLIALLVIGSVTPIHEIHRTIIESIKGEYEFYSGSYIEIIEQKNFGGSVQDSTFYNYLVRK